MLWIPLSVIPSFLYAITNHIDKQLLEKYFKEGGVGTLLLFSTLLAPIIMPYAYVRDPTVLTIGWQNALIMYSAGAMNVLLLWCYFKAMEKDEPTNVILYYQLVPVFTLILGRAVLGETITTIQGMAMGLVLIGTTIASFEVSEAKGWGFKWRTCGYMLVATLCWAGETTVGKIVVIDENVYHSIFWESIALVTIGAGLFVVVPKYRQHFFEALRANKKQIIALNGANEIIYGIGNAVVTHAVKLQSVALVMLFQPTQTIFVFIIGVFLTFFFPKLYREELGHYSLIIKTTAIMLTVAGTCILTVA